MRSKKSLLSLLFITVLSLCLFTGCTDRNSLPGTWNYIQDSIIRNDVYYVFNDDNTGSYNFSGMEKKFNYKIEDNKLVLDYEGSTIPSTFEFRIENGLLIIKDSFGTDITYKKK